MFSSLTFLLLSLPGERGRDGLLEARDVGSVSSYICNGMSFLSLSLHWSYQF